MLLVSTVSNSHSTNTPDQSITNDHRIVSIVAELLSIFLQLCLCLFCLFADLVLG